MTRSEVLYNSYCADYGNVYVAPYYVGNIPSGLPLVDSQASELLMPINPVTGHRDGDLSRLFNPMTSASEKELIMSNLQTIKGNDSRKGLSDEDIMLMIPSKYISDPVEINQYLDELKGYRDALLIKDDDNEDDNSPAPVDPPAGNGDNDTL